MISIVTGKEGGKHDVRENLGLQVVKTEHRTGEKRENCSGRNSG